MPRQYIRNKLGQFAARHVIPTASQWAMRNPYYAAAGAAGVASYNLYKSYRASQNNSSTNNSSTTAPPRQRTRAPMGRNSTRLRTRHLPMGVMQPTLPSGKIRSGPGLRIGKHLRETPRMKISAIMNPPTRFDSKWTFQAECQSGRVSAFSIPVMTQTLQTPMFSQIWSNLTSDVAGAYNPSMAAPGSTNAIQYKTLIKDYRSTLKFYNSSTNTARCRLVWYKPARDMDSVYDLYGANSFDPINMLMIASNNSNAISPPYSLVDSGIQFTSTDYNANYNHAGSNLTGPTTTQSNTNNVVAFLDPSLVPGSPQVRSQFSHFWTTLKSEDFTLEPGNQYNTSLTMRNRIIQKGYEESEIMYRRDSTVIGVVYVLGQIVFADIVGNNTISTGSTQISVIREDTCSVRPLITKRIVRMNLTSPFIRLSTADQAIINTTDNQVDDTYGEDT